MLLFTSKVWGKKTGTIKNISTTASNTIPNIL
jgi:hypothetical protein